MKNVRGTKLIFRSVSLLMIVILLMLTFLGPVYAENGIDGTYNLDMEEGSVTFVSTEPIVVVSLGDSYSSGEGIEPFYGQEKGLLKLEDENWLAHRSSGSWPGQLKISNLPKPLRYYHVEYPEDLKKCKWYFKASSGAETQHFAGEQSKTVIRDGVNKSETLPPQLQVFDQIKADGENVDYVTLTIGGNDIGFTKVVMAGAGSTFGLVTLSFYWCPYLSPMLLNDFINLAWINFHIETKANIKKVYTDIREKAGDQTTIIVAGYPKLFAENIKIGSLGPFEALIINLNVSLFNKEIEKIVNECSAEGMDIHFVDVETKFDEGGGRGAGSSEAWINGFILPAEPEDLVQSGIEGCFSKYSIHPNATGAEKYADCVNAKIEEIKNNNRTGTVFGEVRKKLTPESPIQGAEIKVYKANETEKTYTNVNTDAFGNYALTLEEGEYRVEISAQGYEMSSVEISVAGQSKISLKTFLDFELVEGTAPVIDEQGKKVYISKASELVWLRSAISSGNSFKDYNVELVNNIDMSNINWKNFGTLSDSNKFEGIFNGNNYTISNLTSIVPKEISLYKPVCTGLFGYCYGAKIRNLIIENADFRIHKDGAGDIYVGIICGFSENSTFQNIIVKNSCVSVNVENSSFGSNKSLCWINVGGMVGSSRVGSFRNCVNESAAINVNVGKIARCMRVGGIVGFHYFAYRPPENNIVQCSNTADINVHSAGVVILNNIPRYSAVGGIVGLVIESNIGAQGAACLITDCFNRGNIVYSSDDTNQEGPAIGGIVGNEDTFFSFGVVRCYNSGDIIANPASFASAGGISGVNVGWGGIQSSAVMAANIQGLSAKVIGSSSGINNIASSSVPGTNDANRIYEPEQFYGQDLYVNELAWDFENVWRAQENDYPELRH